MKNFAFSLLFSFVIFGVQKSSGAQTESFDVRTTITARFAETVITSKVRNEKSTSKSVNFHILLPKEAFISGFSMTIDGKRYESIVEEKVKAQKAFQAAKELNKTAGLVATRDESTKTFKTSVNIEAGEVVEFRLVYQQLIRRIGGKYRHQLILLGSQLTDVLSIEVNICETKKILSVAVPPILDSQGNNVTVNTIIKKQRNSARVEYLQGQNEDVVKSLASSGGSFVVEYELQKTDEGEVVLNHGFLSFFYAPEIKIESRRVVFALDVSGSMSGSKINQLQEAMVNIIDKLTEQDRFTVVTFESDISIWKGEYGLHAATRSNIEEAKDFINRMTANGGTNINEALLTSLKILHNDLGNSTTFDPLSNYVVFLTDGVPTAGESSTDKILDNLDQANTKSLPIHAIGFGQDVDTNFLKSLAARNNGSWTQILVDITAALQIQNYLEELSVSAWKDIEISYPTDIVDEFFVHKPDAFFAGGEVIALGKFKASIDPRNRGPHTITITGKPSGNVILRARFHLDDRMPTCFAVGPNTAQDFGRNAFALAEVVEILRQYDATTDDELKNELKEKAINKSITAGLVTPVTSMLVIKPEDMREIEEKVEAEPTVTPTVPTTTPAPRTVPWWQFHGDPHFMVHLTESITACFNWLGNRGEIFNLLNDPQRSIVINGLVGGGTMGKTQDAKHAIFITKLAIVLKRERLVITIDAREAIVRDTSSKSKRERDLRLPMFNVQSYKASYGHVTFRVSDITAAHTILNVTIANDISFIVNLRRTLNGQIHQVDHLDLMISGSERLSENVGGIFGRFPRKSSDDTDSASIETSGSQTLLWYKNEVSPVTRTTMMIPYLREQVSCWFVAKPSAILGGPLDAFKMRNLFQVPRKKKQIGR